jgi:hypothetical protein
VSQGAVGRRDRERRRVAHGVDHRQHLSRSRGDRDNRVHDDRMPARGGVCIAEVRVVYGSSIELEFELSWLRCMYGGCHTVATWS